MPVLNPILDSAHEKLNMALGNVTSLLEGQGMHPCTAMKTAYELIQPAYDAFEELAAIYDLGRSSNERELHVTSSDCCCTHGTCACNRPRRCDEQPEAIGRASAESRE